MTVDIDALYNLDNSHGFHKVLFGEITSSVFEGKKVGYIEYRHENEKYRIYHDGTIRYELNGKIDAVRNAFEIYNYIVGKLFKAKPTFINSEKIENIMSEKKTKKEVTNKQLEKQLKLVNSKLFDMEMKLDTIEYRVGRNFLNRFSMSKESLLKSLLIIAVIASTIKYIFFQ